MKRLFPIYFICGVLFVTGCDNNNNFGEESSSEELKVQVNILPIETTPTKGDNLVGADTVFIDDDVYITAQESVWTPETAVKGKLVNSGTDINKITVNIRNTGATNYAPGAGNLDKSLNYTLNSGAFTTTTPYALPITTSKVTFLAYSPYIESGNGLTTNGTLGEAVNYSIPTDVTKQLDLCVSSINNNTDVVNTGINQAHLRTLNFFHTLTAIGFAMRGDGAKIISAEVSGVGTTGVLKLTTSLTDNKTTLWSSLGSTSTTKYAAGIMQKFFSVPLSANWENCTNDNGYLMMIPQTLTDDAELKVTYTYNTGIDAGKTLSFTTKLKALIPIWYSGSKITYNIRLKTPPVVSSSTSLEIPIFKAGYTTSSAVVFNGLAIDDNITFSWDAAWLKIHRGNPKNDDISGGSPSGWSTGTGGPWNNIYFYATNDNSSTMKRSAKVRVSGVKSQESTITVTQMMKPTLTVSSTSVDIQKYVSRPWENGELRVINYTSNYPESNIKFKDVSSWITPFVSNGKICFSYEWNLQASANRVGSFTVVVQIGNSQYEDRKITVEQRASRFWITTNGNSFSFAISEYDAAAGASRGFSRCQEAGYKGDYTPTRNEYSIIMSYIKTGIWAKDANFKTSGRYWTKDAGNFAQDYSILISSSGSNISYSFSLSTAFISLNYRCLTHNRTAIY